PALQDPATRRLLLGGDDPRRRDARDPDPASVARLNPPRQATSHLRTRPGEPSSEVSRSAPMHPALQFEQAPPIASTFRFFLTAPWFGVAAGLLLAWHGPAAFASRWGPQAMALTHLLTVGFMLQAMAGALLQVVPVVAGGNVRWPRGIAASVHALVA